MEKSENSATPTNQLDAFFRGLRTVVDIAQQAQASLDRHAATAFSVFRYFREDENALSDIFADLLNPHGSHGQGDRFLLAFLHCIDAQSSIIPTAQCRVRREYRTENHRRLDILLEFLGEPPALIGIENKPWAIEQDDQMSDYANTLSGLNQHNWLLIYMSGDGSLPETLPNHQQLAYDQHFVLLPYHTQAATSTLSIEDWLETCHQVCEAERVRWFINDALQYIRCHFINNTNTENGAESK